MTASSAFGRFQTNERMEIAYRVALAWLLVASVGCDSRGDCVRFGPDRVDNVSILINHAEKMGFQIDPTDAAFVVGWAYASSQLEGGQSGVPVLMCLRTARGTGTEFRVMSTNGKPLGGWESTSRNRHP